MLHLDTLAGVEAAIAEEKARLASYLARLRRRRASGLDATGAETLAGAAKGHLASLREHRRWLLAEAAPETRWEGPGGAPHVVRVDEDGTRRVVGP